MEKTLDIDNLPARDVFTLAVERFSSVVDNYQKALDAQGSSDLFVVEVREKTHELTRVIENSSSEQLESVKDEAQSALLRAEMALESDPLDIEEMILSYPFVLTEIISEAQ